MVAPPTTTRVDPTSFGILLADGYQTTIAFQLDPDIELWEKTVQPSGFDGGDMIDQTTMFNAAFRTAAFRSLVTVTATSGVCAYDPDVYDQIKAILNLNGGVTVTFPDGSTLDLWGGLRLFEPQSLEEGSQPEANVTIEVTNFDPVNKVEAGPVMTEVSGT